MARKRIYVIVATFQEKLIIRFVVCSRFCQQEDIEYAWKEITNQAAEILAPVAPLSTPNKLTSRQSSIDKASKTPGAIAARIHDLKIEECKLDSQTIS